MGNIGTFTPTTFVRAPTLSTITANKEDALLSAIIVSRQPAHAITNPYASDITPPKAATKKVSEFKANVFSNQVGNPRYKVFETAFIQALTYHDILRCINTTANALSYFKAQNDPQYQTENIN